MFRVSSLRRFAVLAGAFSLFLIGPAAGLPGSGTAYAAQVGPSGLPIPRFVSLKPGRVNLRVGPGRDYAVTWLFLKSGLPVEIVQEYDNWRRIRDADGTEGWVYQSLLSGRRTAIAAPWQRDKNVMIELRRSADDDARVVAHLEPGVIGTIKECTGEWCRLEVSGSSGWLRQNELWGAYPGEKFDD